MNDDRYPGIDHLLRRVRARWRWLAVYEGTIRAALAVAAVLSVGLVLAGLASRAPVALAVLGLLTLVLALAAAAWGALPIRQVPTDARLARYIEERHAALDDRLVSAVSLLNAPDPRRAPSFGPSLLADAERAASSVDPDTVILPERVRRTAFQAAGALLLLGAVILFGRETARQSIDAAWLSFFPARVSLEVTPGNARIQFGAPLTIEARLVGNRAPVVARLVHVDEPSGDDAAWNSTDMGAADAGGFTLKLDSVNTSFKYRVVAGTVESPVYAVAVARAPRVTRVDVEYRYPPSLGVEPHTDEDGGDIYAPAGTDVRVRVHVDRPAATGALLLGDGGSLVLKGEGDDVMAAAFRLERDNSYRIALADGEGLRSPGDTEYFIRLIDDRPPEVHVTKPARDRAVTKLEEVEIEARADDDFGIDRMELVYAVRGGAEKIVPLAIPNRSSSVTARRMLYLEDLDVEPGDFVSYYVRARDVSRGKRPSEGRSDIFFLEVKPFEQEFALAQSLAGSGNRTVDDLVAAQKEVIVATFKLDRRGETANARPVDDIRAVAGKEAELRGKAEAASSASRGSTLRNPRRQGGLRPPDGARGPAGPAREDAMTAATAAMGRAVDSLNALKTGEALPHEMEALNQLLRAQSEVRKQQISRQAGNGQNRSTQDLSSLFDKELQREQQTNYETPTSTENRDTSTVPDRIKDLARRQDELNRRQQDMANGRESPASAERQRELEKLQREQADLRRQAEQLAQEMARTEQQGQEGQAGRSGQSGQAGQQMRAISEQMRSAANDLQRQDPRQASERGANALRRLQDLERQLRSNDPDAQRRALGDTQLEARQLADAERQISAELNQMKQGPAAADGRRRLAGEQERLANRTRRVQDALEQQAAALAGSGKPDTRTMQQAVSEAARSLQRGQVADRMRQSADAMRAAAARPESEARSGEQDAKTVEAQMQVARELDALAEKLGAAAMPRDEDARRLAERRARAQELRQELDRLGHELERAGKAEQPGPANQGRSGAVGREAGGRAGSGGAGAELARLRDDYMQKLRESRELLDQLRREDPSFSSGGSGFTFEGQGMTLSAPGTEAFKQDFARWEQLRQQASQLLTRAETQLSKRLQAAEAHDRLAAGADDGPPPAYQQQVDQYFRGLAGKR